MTNPLDPVEIRPGVVKILAPNASLMTGAGTNSYLIGEPALIAIDPGPDDEEHVGKLAELAAGRLRYILITHHHPDHAPGATRLAEMTRAPILSFGAVPISPYFATVIPDHALSDGDVVSVPGLSLTTLHTPGHTSDHLSFIANFDSGERRNRVLFSGDTVLGGSTVVVSPPDGDMVAYMSSLERMLHLSPAADVIAPGHGDLIEEPAGTISDYLARRRAREMDVLDALRIGPANATDLVDMIYSDLARGLYGVAARTVWAHLRKLGSEKRAFSSAPDDIHALWTLARPN
jgi:glyoxylase-like metal-dependent hydrolase (beta-lactamase superfamily II)